MAKHVHVVGTGTIGEPLLGLLCAFRKSLGIETITFNKKQALTYDRPKVKALIRRGAQLCATDEMASKFEELGMRVDRRFPVVLDDVDVVVDCTPAGKANKAAFYDCCSHPVGFIAQGSEFGFGKPFAVGVNDEALTPTDKFVQVVSCNTHNLAVVVDTIALPEDDPANLVDGRFVLLRRATDTSQDDKFIPAPQAGKHDDDRFGTHHARDAWHLFRTLGYDLPIFSSAMKLPTQYMHAMWFSIRLRETITLAEVMNRLRGNPRIALTEKCTSNSIFSFGRDQGFYGRLFCQTVVSLPTLAVRDEHEVVGFTFTPQDGNSLLSSLAAVVRFLYPEDYRERIRSLDEYFFNEI